MLTHERPMVPGWYWLRIPDEVEEVVEIVRGQACLAARFDGRTIDLDRRFWDDCEWKGPIPSMEELAQWRTDRAALIAALVPFARLAAALDGEPDAAVYDCWYILDGLPESVLAAPPTVGDVRYAAEVFRNVTSREGAPWGL